MGLFGCLDKVFFKSGSWRKVFESSRERLFAGTDGAPLAVFRILFGILMIFEVLRYWTLGRIERYYVEPDFLFPFIEGIKPLAGDGMYFVFVLMGASAVLLALGYYYRFASVSFFVLYTYVFLLDKTQYNNHYYLISLLAFLFIVTNANKVFSVDARRKKFSSSVPYWQVFIFRVQIFLIFFFAGIAKINADWLAGEPARAWLANRSDYFLIGPLLSQEWFVYLYSYGGLLFDLFIGFVLWSPALYVGLVFLVGFNAMNWWFYNIGIFPYLATAVFILFMKASVIRKLPGLKKKGFSYVEEKESSRKRNLIMVFVIVFILLQVLVPLRHFAIEGNVSWTDESHNFAWHMKLRDKDTYRIVFYTFDNLTGGKRELPTSDLTDRQRTKMSTRPHMIIYYAHHLRDRLMEEGIQNPSIHVRTITSLNSGPWGPLINESVNLANQRYKHFSHNEWIMPEP